MSRSFRIKQMRPKDVMQYLGINQKFIINKSSFSFGKDNNTSSAPNSARSSTLEKVKMSLTERTQVPYFDAIREIEKI